MASVASALALAIARPHRFSVAMSASLVLIAFGRFTPNYWAKLASQRFSAAPIVYIHGTPLSIWTLFYFAQVSLVAAARTPDRRRWGMAGISLATAMVISMLLVMINSMQNANALGMHVAGQRCAIVPFSSLILFVVFFAAAVVTARDSELHKRLMILAMIPLLQAAIGRVFNGLLEPPGTIGLGLVTFAVVLGLAAVLLIVVAITYDWRTRGRPHQAYLVSGSLLIAKQFLIVPIGATAWWLAFAASIEGLAG